MLTYIFSTITASYLTCTLTSVVLQSCQPLSVIIQSKIQPQPSISSFSNHSAPKPKTPPQNQLNLSSEVQSLSTGWTESADHP